MTAHYGPSLVAGKAVYGTTELGILGSVIRATTGSGDNGPGILYNDWDSSADDGKRFRALIVSGAPAGAVFNEDGSFTVPPGTADGVYSVVYRLFVDGVDMGATTASITIGAVTFSVTPTSIPSAAIVGLPSFAFTVPFSVSPFGVAPASVVGLPTFDFVIDATSTLVVEDGSGLEAADSYASVQYADQYHAGRGNAAWSDLTVHEKDIKLRVATDYLQQHFAGRWKGYRLTSLQALDWPRYGVTVDRVALVADDLPTQLERACCELALKAITQPLMVDEGAQVRSETVGPLAVVYADGARQQTRFAAVEAMLAPLLASGSGFGSIKLTRG